jgi:hypothetical protein
VEDGFQGCIPTKQSYNTKTRQYSVIKALKPKGNQRDKLDFPELQYISDLQQ